MIETVKPAAIFLLVLFSAATANAQPPAHDALAEVNAARAKKGLKPFQHDDGLTQAAKSAASYRAARHMRGHTANDFAFVPKGTVAKAAGCSANEPEWGWRTCCMYGDWTKAGAAWAMGNDGRRYCHLYVRD